MDKRRQACSTFQNWLWAALLQAVFHCMHHATLTSLRQSMPEQTIGLPRPAPQSSLTTSRAPSRCGWCVQCTCCLAAAVACCMLALQHILQAGQKRPCYCRMPLLLPDHALHLSPLPLRAGAGTGWRAGAQRPHCCGPRQAGAGRCVLCCGSLFFWGLAAADALVLCAWGAPLYSCCLCLEARRLPVGC